MTFQHPVSYQIFIFHSFPFSHHVFLSPCTDSSLNILGTNLQCGHVHVSYTADIQLLLLGVSGHWPKGWRQANVCGKSVGRVCPLRIGAVEG